MSTTGLLGWFGKLPCAGDFLGHGLPTDVSTPIDLWLSANLKWLANSQANWVALYLQAPASGFFIPEACITPQKQTCDAVGLFMPSVDSVGRLYPFVIFQGIEHSVLAENNRLQSGLKALWTACSTALDLNWSTGQLSDAIYDSMANLQIQQISGSWNAPAILKGPTTWFDLSPQHMHALHSEPLPHLSGWPLGPEFLALIDPAKGHA